jgi:hypothetical protein
VRSLRLLIKETVIDVGDGEGKIHLLFHAVALRGSNQIRIRRLLALGSFVLS